MNQAFMRVGPQFLHPRLEVFCIGRTEALGGSLDLRQIRKQSRCRVVRAGPPRGEVPALCSACHSRTAFIN